jgi:beta-glucanase (GH16 family)
LNLSPTGSGTYNWYKSYWWNSYLPPAQNITVLNGILNLQWTRGQGGSETTISTFAHDASQGRSFRYGYFEARMRWDVVNGAWPAFWAIPIQAAQGQQHTGELDFFEGEGADPHTFFGTAHEWQGGTPLWSNSPNYYPVGSNTDFSQWHTYGALWQPGMISWYLDGQLLHATNLPAIFDQQNYFLVLSMQEGANWSPGNLSGVSASQMNLQVDYVRVWQP